MTDFETQGSPPMEEVSVSFRITSVPSEDVPRLEIMLQDEAREEGMTAYLDPADAVELGSFLSNVERKMDDVESDNLGKWEP